MRKLAVALILASVLAFLLATVLVIFRQDAMIVNMGAEGFSRASSNLALIAIALGVWFRVDSNGPDDDD
jgi:hypothetical protein